MPEGLDSMAPRSTEGQVGESLVRTAPEGVLTSTASHELEGAARNQIINYVLIFERDTSRMFQLPRTGEVSIGRAQTSTLLLEDPAVSRQHAKIVMLEGYASIHDLGSQNGTRLNGERLSEPRPLAFGDIVTIGEVSIAFHAHERTSIKRAILDYSSFIDRTEEELERGIRYARPFAVVTVALGESRDKVAQGNAVLRSLRATDKVGWSPDGKLLHLLLGETRAEAARFTAQRLLELPELASITRAGVAAFPEDGRDIPTLLSASIHAARGADPQKVQNAADIPHTITIAGKQVVVADPVMRSLFDLVRRLAESNLPILISGETGSGKEIVSSAIHAWSPVAKGPLVALNCAAIHEHLMESELFGHERGAFSGANAAKPGLLESASGGTVLLDEVGELPLSLQAKLLRVLETKRVARLGEVHEREIDIRILAATNRDLAEEVEAGRFRQDLFFRLSGATIWVPPLRERKHDLQALARTFLREACLRAGRAPMSLSEAAIAVILGSPWPGNVRELKNVMEYVAVAFREPELRPEHLQQRMLRGGSGSRLGPGTAPAVPAEEAPPEFRPIDEEVKELEVRRMVAALEAARGNKTRAAALINMPRRTFAEKLKQYGIKVSS